MLGLSHLTHPESWWTAFSLTLGGRPDASAEHYRQLSGAIERFPVDTHRHSPALLHIWLAYLDLHWYARPLGSDGGAAL